MPHHGRSADGVDPCSRSGSLQMVTSFSAHESGRLLATNSSSMCTTCFQRSWRAALTLARRSGRCWIKPCIVKLAFSSGNPRSARTRIVHCTTLDRLSSSRSGQSATRKARPSQMAPMLWLRRCSSNVVTRAAHANLALGALSRLTHSSTHSATSRGM